MTVRNGMTMNRFFLIPGDFYGLWTDRPLIILSHTTCNSDNCKLHVTCAISSYCFISHKLLFLSFLPVFLLPPTLFIISISLDSFHSFISSGTTKKLDCSPNWPFCCSKLLLDSPLCFLALVFLMPDHSVPVFYRNRWRVWCWPGKRPVLQCQCAHSGWHTGWEVLSHLWKVWQ